MAGPQVTAPRIVIGNPPELVVYDREQPCPYLKDRTSRLPLRLPARPLTPSELNTRLLQGDRRQGYVFYRPSCPSCSACEPIRLDVRAYRLTRTQKRVKRRGEAELTYRIQPPSVDARRVEIYNLHKTGRELRDGQPPIDADGFRDFLVATSCDTFEIAYFREEKLVGFSIVDRSDQALSAVYTAYDPAFSRYSLGTYSILRQLELCSAFGLPYLYLGLYIRECETMHYKARFVPHERLVRGRWIRQDEPLDLPPLPGGAPPDGSAEDSE